MKTIIIKPIITEKSMKDAPLGKFTFAVAKDASKYTVKHEVEQRFGVKVVSIATVTMKGKTHRTGRRMVEVPKSSWKKAVVKLRAGDKIALFDTGGK